MSRAHIELDQEELQLVIRGLTTLREEHQDKVTIGESDVIVNLIDYLETEAK